MHRTYPPSVIPLTYKLFRKAFEYGTPEYWYRLPIYLLNDTLFLPLSMLEHLKYSETIKKSTLSQDPIFILGHWRSGTTFLHNLLIQHRAFSYQNAYQKIMPKDFLHTEKIFGKTFQKITDLLGIQLEFQRRKWDNSAPGEEEVALAIMGIPQSSVWLYIFPRDIEHLKKYLTLADVSIEDKLSWEVAYTFWVQKISYANCNKPLILKNPPNTARIPTLLKLYPNAKFVYVHRNPFEVYSSTRKMWELIQKQYSFEKLNKEDIHKNVLGIYDIIHTSYQQHRTLIAPKNLMEVYYEDVIRDPLSSFKSIFHYFNIDISTDSIMQVEQFIRYEQKHKRDTHSFEKMDKDLQNFMQSFKMNERYF